MSKVEIQWLANWSSTYIAFLTLDDLCNDFESLYMPTSGQFNDFSTAQTQFLVVVKHSVHILDPHGIHRAIKHEPAVVGVIGRCTHTDQGG